VSFLRTLFGPWSYGRDRGRVHVLGCAPGCILASIVVSLFLTLLLNGCLRALS
jgi:hypothetical protein